MSRFYSLLASMLLVLSLAACGDNDDDTAATDADAAISVVATTAQIGALVHEVAGDEVDLVVLMPSGTDPHDFEMTPSDMQAVGEADLILKNGIGLDDFLDANMDAAGGDATIVVVTEGIEPVEGGHAHDEGEHEEDEHDHEGHEEHEEGSEHEDEHEGEYDPHVWHDPANAITMVDNIVAALAAADPDRSSLFQKNGEAYKTVLEETDAEIRAMLAEIPPENRKLVTTHDAFGYFVRAYDFEFIGAVIPSVSTDAEPSAREIAEIAELIEHENVKAIFAEDTIDPRVAEQLARDTGVQIVYGLHSDSLGEPGTDEATIHGMLLANAAKISEALK